MTARDEPACVRLCAPFGSETGHEGSAAPASNTAQHSAAGLLERLAALHEELGRTHRELAKHVEIRLAAGAEKSVITHVDSTSTSPARLLTTKDFADLLQVDEKTLRRWRNDGLLPPALELGGVVRWSPDRIRRWIAEVSR